MGQMGINLRLLDVMAGRVLSVLRKSKKAAQTPLLEKLDVKACPLGANRAIKTLWREMLEALIGRQN